jgi:hypothetical protein
MVGGFPFGCCSWPVGLDLVPVCSALVVAAAFLVYSLIFADVVGGDY